MTCMRPQSLQAFANPVTHSLSFLLGLPHHLLKDDLILPLCPSVRAESNVESEYDFDFFVIGSGSGGTRASRIAASLGMTRSPPPERPPCTGWSSTHRPFPVSGGVVTIGRAFCTRIRLLAEEIVSSDQASDCPI